MLIVKQEIENKQNLFEKSFSLVTKQMKNGRCRQDPQVEDFEYKGGNREKKQLDNYN